MSILPIAMMFFALLLFVRGLTIFAHKSDNPSKQAVGTIMIVLATALVFGALSTHAQ